MGDIKLIGKYVIADKIRAEIVWQINIKIVLL